MSEIRVALIEDHDLTRVGLRTALQGEDDVVVVGEAANAAKGLTLLQMYRPDVAIVDIGLPDMDGIELTRRLKESLAGESGPTPKVLMLTMHDSDDSVLAAFAAGADSYCIKDIRFEKLLEAVRSTHRGDSWIDPAIARIVLRQAKTGLPTAGDSEPAETSISALNPEDRQILEASPLTEREMDVLRLIVDGYNNAKISEELHISVGTVKTHVRSILNKLCASDRTQAAVLALRSGLVK